MKKLVTLGSVDLWELMLKASVFFDAKSLKHVTL